MLTYAENVMTEKDLADITAFLQGLAGWCELAILNG
jgi:hypothetical protein